MLPRKFEKEHRNHVLLKFENFASERGFTRKRRDLFVRQASDGLYHGIWVHEWVDKYRILRISPALIVGHREIGKLIHTVLYSDSEYANNRTVLATRDWLTIGVVNFLLVAGTGRGALADYPVEEPSNLDSVLADTLTNTQSVFDPFFNEQSTLDELVDYYERNLWAGGTAHWVKLLATLFYMNREMDLKELISNLEKNEVAHVTQWMIDYVSKEMKIP